MRTWLGLCLLVLLLVPSVAYGDMVSNNFYIYADSVGLNGGAVATSTSYFLNDTINDAPGGQVTSTSYSLYGGYQAMDTSESLTMVLSNIALDFGTISRTAVTNASTLATITTGSQTGYSLSISNVSGSLLSDVSDGAVTGASEEYGLGVTGAYAAFADDRAVTAGRILSSAGGVVSAATTTITFKIAASSNSTVGTYAQTVTLTASANF